MSTTFSQVRMRHASAPGGIQIISVKKQRGGKEYIIFSFKYAKQDFFCLQKRQSKSQALPRKKELLYTIHLLLLNIKRQDWETDLSVWCDAFPRESEEGVKAHHSWPWGRGREKGGDREEGGSAKGTLKVAVKYGRAQGAPTLSFRAAFRCYLAETTCLHGDATESCWVWLHSLQERCCLKYHLGSTCLQAG